MADDSPEGRISFPVINRVRLRSFSLYGRNPNPEIITQRGVTCFAGANGIGKSTLLSTINYGLTGYVPDPNRIFKSVEEYVTQQASSFTENYFNGRIGEAYRDDAAIELEFSLGRNRFQICRGLFDHRGLEGLEIFDKEGKQVWESSDLTSIQRDDEYRSKMSELTGLKNFEQFVFLQHFVFTFDEGRSLLFWSGRALDAVKRTGLREGTKASLVLFQRGVFSSPRETCHRPA